MSGKPGLKHRSGCPVSISLEIFGDRWSLLIIRDLMTRGLRTFKEFLGSGEGIASNILADRLQRLQTADMISAQVSETDGRSIRYRLTEKGIDFAPVLLDLLIWAARNEATAAPCETIRYLEEHRDSVLKEARRRWQADDLTPLIPQFRTNVPEVHRAKKHKTQERKTNEQRTSISGNKKGRLRTNI